MRKPAFYICENKDADQLRGNREGEANREADHHLCFRYLDSTIPFLPKSPAIFRGCTTWSVLDLVRNPENRFSRNVAHLRNGIPVWEKNLALELSMQ